MEDAAAVPMDGRINYVTKLVISGDMVQIVKENVGSVLYQKIVLAPTECVLVVVCLDTEEKNALKRVKQCRLKILMLLPLLLL